jgi:hypothetical protein
MNKQYLFGLSKILFLSTLTCCSPTMQVQKKTYATITNPEYHGFNNNTYAIYSFDIEGKKTSLLDFYYPSYVLGEKFVVFYDSLRPSNYSLEITRPIFAENERVKKVSGKVIELTSYDCKFKYLYEVDNIIYSHSRSQYLGNYQNKFPFFKIGGEYEVEYWVDNPLRAIIYPDRTVMEPITPKANVKEDHLVIRPNQLMILGTPETYTSSNDGKDYRFFKGDSPDKPVAFRIDGYLFLCDKLKLDIVSNTYTAMNNVTMRQEVGSLNVSGYNLTYNQLSGIVQMDGGGIDLITGQSTIKWLEEVSIDILSKTITYKKNRIVTKITF